MCDYVIQKVLFDSVRKTHGKWCITCQVFTTRYFYQFPPLTHKITVLYKGHFYLLLLVYLDWTQQPKCIESDIPLNWVVQSRNFPYFNICPLLNALLTQIRFCEFFWFFIWMLKTTYSHSFMDGTIFSLLSLQIGIFYLQ